MIDVRAFQNNPDLFIAGIKRRGVQFEIGLSSLASLLKKKDAPLQHKIDELRHQLSLESMNITKLGAEAKRKKLSNLKLRKQELTKLESRATRAQHDIEQIARELPNLPKDDVPDGSSDRQNIVLREVGGKNASGRSYLDIAEKLALIDMARGAKTSGSRFGILRAGAAELEFALIRYAYDRLLPQGFVPVIPPVMIKSNNMRAMGYLAGGGESETYHFKEDDLYLVGTSEQSIGPMHRDEVFTEEQLPLRYLSFSTCFRREAGSYGRDTRGILRVHQFDKLEMFSFAAPEKSDEEHDFILAQQELLWQGIGIPYRVTKTCTGDLSWPSARSYDIEAWLPSEQRYREVASASTTTDYQARDLKIFVKRQTRRELVHLLNGTAFAIGRALIAIIENCQQPDGSVTIPPALVPYMPGGKTALMPVR